MRMKFLVAGAVAGGLTLYLWQTISNVVLPWHEMVLTEVADGPALSQTIRTAAPQNGVYFVPQGVLMAVSFRPDMADKTQFMGSMLGLQVVIDLVVAFALAALMLRFSPATPVRHASTLGLAALVVSALIHASNWNWYGFSSGYTLVNIADATVGVFLAGLVIGVVLRKMSNVVADLPGVRAEGDLRTGDSLRGSDARR